MKKLVLGAIALAGMMISAQALAADMPLKARPMAVDPAYDWSGFYVGAGVGGVSVVASRFMPDLPLVGLPPQTFTTPRANDWIFSGFGGVQGQWGRWVIGVEASYNAGSSKDMRADTSISPPEPFGRLDASTMITDLVMIGPKVGYTWDRLMVYGTGGYAGAHVEGRYSCSEGGVFILPGPGPCLIGVFGPELRALSFSGKSWNNGWFAGAGFDYLAYKGSFADVLIGAEYKHFELQQTRGFTCTPAVCQFAPHQGFFHGAYGDMAQVRLTFKTHGWGIN
jgi:outer membrane immunogenic protein